MKHSIRITPLLLLLFCCIPLAAYANKSAVKIEAPSEAAKGSDITIKLTVTHNGNSALHHTEWLKVKANGKPLEEWNYTASKRPDDSTFTKEIKIKAVEDLEITAQASCNLHGSAGQVTTKITVR